MESRSYDFVAWNPETVPAFADPDVRRALSLAIDRAEILAALDMGEYAEAAGGPYPPIFRALRDPAIRPDPYLPDSARDILRRRGFTDSNGDGVLDRNGRPFRFTLTTNEGNARRASVVQLLQAQLRRVGVDVQPRVLESNTFWDAVFGLRYEAAVAGWGVGLTPEWGLQPFFYPGQSLNVTRYENPRVTALIDSALVQASPQAAAPYWRAAARQVVEDRPYAWLYYYDGLVGVNERVRNTRIDTYGAYQNLYAWRIARPGAHDTRSEDDP
jgi:peptide/nickel transport system substrate-binding protein